MNIKLTPMIAAHIADLAREHDETPDEVVGRVLAARFFNDEELDLALDEIDMQMLDARPPSDPAQRHTLDDLRDVVHGHVRESAA